MKTVGVRFSPTQITRLEKIANSKNCNISDILRELVNSNFEETDKNKAIEDLKKELATKLDALSEAMDKKISSHYDLMVKLSSNQSVINKNIIDGFNKEAETVNGLKSAIGYQAEFLKTKLAKL